ncbi:MAG: hypothetical protein J6T70_12775 [Bacteroidales bacterium]|nr:hypothetical protein [Bacteroidales bacterium]
MMNLIVLKGEENSGKTITLKMVYERLKTFNLLDTHWFKYYDDDGAHRDFRDVLILNTSKAIAAYPPISPSSVTCTTIDYDGSDISILKSLFDDVDFNYIKDPSKLINEHQSISEYDYGKDYDETEELDRTYDDNLRDKLDTLRETSDNSVSESHIETTLNTVSKFKPNGINLIGFVLEGDYGFAHAITKSTTTHHSRCLYDHLKTLEFCNSLICACSIPAIGTHPRMNPVYCVVKFIIDYASKYGSIRVVLINSNRSSSTSWSTKISIDKAIAHQIINNI